MYASFSQKTDKIRIYQKTLGICIICGKPVPNEMRAWSLEHYIPRAIYKWVPNAYVQSQIESETNLFIVHERCNFQKDSTLPTLHTIDHLHASPAIKDELYDLYDDIKYAIYRYKAIKQAVWVSQDKCCAFCKKSLSFGKSILRRRDFDLPRTQNNAICLCFSCSLALNSPKHLIQSVTVIKKTDIKKTKP